MQVMFSTKTAYGVADLVKMTGMESVGFDPDFNSSAVLFVEQDGKLIKFCGGAAEEAYIVAKGDANLNPVGSVRVNGVSYDPDFLKNAPTWITVRSGFAYQLVGCEGDDPEHPDRQIWLYTGAENGFLAQNLLPPMTDPVVEWAKGTYGEFAGTDALDQYAKLKGAWSALWWPIYEGLQGRVIRHSNGWGASAFIADMWKWVGGQFVESYLGERKTFDPAEPHKLCRAVLEAALASLDKMEAQATPNPEHEATREQTVRDQLRQ